MNYRRKRATGIALALLAPNFLGFLVFTAGPVIFSLVVAFTNWNLTVHNDLSQQPVHFIGFDNFRTLFVGHEWRYFSQYLWNTLYLMIGIPIGIALSLIGALLLNGEMPVARGRQGSKPVALTVILTLITSFCCFFLGLPPMVTFMVALTGILVLLGQLFGQTSFRTLYYLPNLTSGVAIFILWKALYRPDTGPINRMLQPVLDGLGYAALHAPSWLFSAGGILLYLVAGGLFIWVLLAMVNRIREGDTGLIGGIGSLIGVAAIAWAIIAIGHTCYQLPQLAQGGLTAPEWLSSTIWSKPALMIMGIFMAMGSNNMLLYLAALSNVPPSLCEAAGIDGANKWQVFWNVTWPQLAPTTFFIVIMSTIGGLQGGFETAKIMTSGGPAGSTTTLSYYLYTRGFEDFQLGLASAIAWTMFIMIFILTLINWKFGNTMVND